ncbi:MAG: hypothetical protein PVI57_05770 [Gemmatimonadota bacterium]|jgi:hypothetical protein
MNQPRSYVANGVLAATAAGLWWTYGPGRPEPGVIVWSVVGALGAALLWNLVRLGQRLHGAGGEKAVWHETRTVLFWVLGLMNTVWARPGEERSWHWWVGVVLLVLAAVDTVALAVHERRIVARAGGHGVGDENR